MSLIRYDIHIVARWYPLVPRMSRTNKKEERFQRLGCMEQKRLRKIWQNALRKKRGLKSLYTETFQESPRNPRI